MNNITVNERKIALLDKACSSQFTIVHLSQIITLKGEVNKAVFLVALYSVKWKEYTFCYKYW